MNQLKKLLSTDLAGVAPHVGLLLLRLGAGLYMGLFHGKNALMELLAGNTDFPDPLGMGSGTVKLLMGVFAEFFCAWLVVLGLFTRLACIPLVVGFGI
ncbi:MAG: DoxX family membrane protein, partial [Bacteroidota bacterium]